MKPLTPTQISRSKQPVNCVIRLAGGGPHKGQYVLRQQCDGWLLLTVDKDAAHKMAHWAATEQAQRMCWNAQYCYGGKFEVVNLDTPIRNVVDSRYTWNVIMAPGGRIPPHWFKKHVFTRISSIFSAKHFSI